MDAPVKEQERARESRQDEDGAEVLNDAYEYCLTSLLQEGEVGARRNQTFAVR